MNILKIVILSCVVCLYSSVVVSQENLSLDSNEVLTENEISKQIADKDIYPVNPQEYEKAKQWIQKLWNKNQRPRKDAGLNSWTEIGPIGIGGKVNDFVIDPMNQNHIIAGTEGGIWQTYNGGFTWSNVDDFLASLYISGLSYDPNNNNTIYAITGGKSDDILGEGLLKSTDNGNTWVQLNTPSGFNFYYLNDIVLDPNNPNWIYVISRDSTFSSLPKGKLFRSQDGGISWQQLIEFNSYGVDIAIDPFDSDNMIIGCNSDVYRTNNAQSASPTYINMSPGNIPSSRTTVAYAPSEQDKVYIFINSDNEDMWVSDDGGATWTGTNTTTYKYFPHQEIWVDPFDSDALLFGGYKLEYSTDGGALWQDCTYPYDDINGNAAGANNSAHFGITKILPSNVYNGTTATGIYISTLGGIYYRGDVWSGGTAGWSSKVGNTAHTHCTSGAVSTDGNTLLAGSYDNSFSWSTDSGATWEQWNVGSAYNVVINPDDADELYADASAGKIWKSSDHGNTWTMRARFDASSAGGMAACSTDPNGCVDNGIFYKSGVGPHFIFHFGIDPNDKNTFYVSVNSGLWKNDNDLDPNSWSLLSNYNLYNLEIASGSSSTMWAVELLDNLRRSTDGGNTWSADLTPSGITSSSPVFYRARNIAIKPNDTNQVVVSMYSYPGGYTLWHTTNANASNPTWVDITPHTGLPVNDITWHPTADDFIYLATDYGILATDDLGQSWSVTPLYNTHGHEGPVNIKINDLFWQPDTETLYAATAGRGLWKSNDILDKVHVDKTATCTAPFVCDGSSLNPFDKITDGLNVAGNGSSIVIFSNGVHEEVSGNNSLLITKRVSFDLQNGGQSVLIE